MKDTLTIDYFAVSLPDFLIFDQSLDLRNRHHCHYLIGLGCLGREEWDAAIEAFGTVLGDHFTHSGDAVRRKMALGRAFVTNDNSVANKA